MKTCVILPTYNESDNIKEIVSTLSNVAKKNKLNLKILIVDDNSPDGTGDIAEKLKNKFSLDIIHREGKLGLGTAYIRGFKYALKNKYDLAITMDSDLSHDPNVIPHMVDKIKDGYDLVLGSRYIKGGGIYNWSIFRRIVSKGANILASTILFLPMRDVTTGYRCYRNKVLSSLNLDEIRSNGYSFLQEILYRVYKKGFKMGEVPILFKDRKAGASKLGKKEMFKFLKTLLVLRFKKL